MYKDLLKEFAPTYLTLLKSGLLVQIKDKNQRKTFVADEWAWCDLWLRNLRKRLDTLEWANHNLLVPIKERRMDFGNRVYAKTRMESLELIEEYSSKLLKTLKSLQ